MSAYYHSPARDLFVGGLWATGVVLVSYLWWKFKTWDFSLSLVAGIAVLSVATFPTGAPTWTPAEPVAPPSRRRLARQSRRPWAKVP